jgi:uncharacterized protein
MGKAVALVTGASSGLGEALARLFAKDGHDLILVARTRAKLEELAKELEQQHGTRAEVLPADLADPATPQALFDQVKAKGLAVDFLVNNAGFGSNGPFLDLDLNQEVQMVEVNVTALVKLTHLFAGPMRDRKQGRILNIASTAAFQPGPYMATYYATKAFVLSFSEALAYELKDAGVTVTCHCPGATATGFAGRAGNDKAKAFQRPGVATGQEVAAHAYRAMMSGKSLKVHGGLNTFGAVGTRFVPRSISKSIAATMNRP